VLCSNAVGQGVVAYNKHLKDANPCHKHDENQLANHQEKELQNDALRGPHWCLLQWIAPMTVDVIFSNCGHRHQNVVTVACHCFGSQTCCNGLSCSLSPALSLCMSTCVLQDFLVHDINLLPLSNGG